MLGFGMYGGRQRASMQIDFEHAFGTGIGVLSPLR